MSLLAATQLHRLASAVIGVTAAQYGANPDQAATLVSAARGTLCTQALG